MTEKKTLNELVAKVQNAMIEIELSDSEIPDSILAEIVAVRETDKLELTKKLDGYGIILDKIKISAKFWKDREDACKRSRKALESLENNLKNNLIHAIETLDGQSLEGEATKFSICDNPGRLVIENESLVPAQFKFVVQTTEMDKEEIREALKRFEDVPGARLVFGKNLRKTNRLGV